MNNLDCLYCSGGIVATELYEGQVINVCMFGHRTAHYQEPVDVELPYVLEA